MSSGTNCPAAPAWQLMPDVYDPDTTWSSISKKRYDCFAATELDHVLRAEASTRSC